jgi:hypothetical protein
LVATFRSAGHSRIRTVYVGLTGGRVAETSIGVRSSSGQSALALEG